MSRAAEKAQLAKLLGLVAFYVRDGRWPSFSDLGLDPVQLAERLETAAGLLDPQSDLFPQAKAETEGAGKAHEHMILFADGGSRGNPGPAGAGAVLCDAAEEPVARLSRYLGRATNNVAEYQALIMGLEAALARGVKHLEVRLDSELIVKQLGGAYKVKSPHLKPLFTKAKSLLRDIPKVNIIHIRREFNAEADSLANEAMDRRIA